MAGSPAAGIGENTQGNKGVLIVSVGGGFAVCRAGSAGGEKHAGKQGCFCIFALPAGRRLRCCVEEMHGNQCVSAVSVFAVLRDFRKTHGNQCVFNYFQFNARIVYDEKNLY